MRTILHRLFRYRIWSSYLNICSSFYGVRKRHNDVIGGLWGCVFIHTPADTAARWHTAPTPGKAVISAFSPLASSACLSASPFPLMSMELSTQFILTRLPWPKILFYVEHRSQEEDIGGCPRICVYDSMSLSLGLTATRATRTQFATGRPVCTWNGQNGIKGIPNLRVFGIP